MLVAFMLNLAYVQPFMSKHLIESNSSTNVKGKQKKEEKVWFDFNQISRIISNNCLLMFLFLLLFSFDSILEKGYRTKSLRNAYVLFDHRSDANKGFSIVQTSN